VVAKSADDVESVAGAFGGYLCCKRMPIASGDGHFEYSACAWRDLAFDEMKKNLKETRKGNEAPSDRYQN
jgi:hypothetical protein